MTRAKSGSHGRTKRVTRNSGGGLVGSEEEEASAPVISVFQEVRPDSDPPFEAIRSLLQSSYLVPESENCFEYSQASLVTNEFFTEEFKTFALQKKESNYVRKELEETFAFLLFDNEREAKLVCQNGLCVGNSSTTTLGDPVKGVYVSKYADYLHPRPWFHGKAGYIVIFKLIKGKVKVVPENYTTNYTVPSPGYDCHVSAKNSRISVKTSHFQAFELTQYYVYELSNDRILKRPRQLCPYAILAFQYSEPRHIILDKNRLVRSTEELYTAWSGQLFIMGQPLCDVAFKSPFSASLPAQLSDKLKVKNIMKVSQLKKKLPEDVFDRGNYTDTEVCYDGVYCSLYDVMTSSSVEEKLNKLKEHMKNDELAIIKLLGDEGFLILITSSVLKPSQDLGPTEPFDLHALFIFPSSRITCFTGDLSSKETKELKTGKPGDKMSATVTTLLPGLQYALQQAKEAQLAETLHRGAQVEEYFQEFVRSRPPSPQSSSISSPHSFDIWQDFPTPEVFSKLAFSHLATYISNSSLHALEMSKALELFARCSKSKYAVSDKSPEKAPPSVTPPETMVAVMEVETVKNSEVCVDDGEYVDSEGQVHEDSSIKDDSKNLILKKPKNKKPLRRSIFTTKKRKKLPRKVLISAADQGVSLRLTTPVVPDPSGAPTKEKVVVKGVSETTLKLASAPVSDRRKRGAEVLTAEVVRKTDSKSTDKAALPQGDNALLSQEVKATLSQEDQTTTPQEDAHVLLQEEAPEPKRSKRLIKIPLKGFPADEESSKRIGKDKVKSKQTAQIKSKPGNKSNEKQSPGGRKSILLSKSALEKGDTFNKTIDSIVKSSSTEREALRKRLPDELYEGDVDVSVLAQRLTVYESHALNLLADLALSSGSAYNSTSFGEDMSIEEHQALLRENLEQSVCDHEYSRSTKHPKGALPSSTSKSSLATYLQSENTTADEEIHATQLSAKGHELDPSSPKKVILEHSYASSAAERARRAQLLKGASTPNAKNRGKGWQEGAPVGRVLPFRPQQDTAGSPKESDFLTEKRKKGILGQYKGFDCPRTVFRRYGKVKVTFKWEEEYLFHGDSKYTSDPLEKTINRALHGPWDSDIPNHVEDVKLILHMWIALFYSKPSKLLNTASRKVVEHNNPAKYVSINSTLDSFELFEDCNGSNKSKVGFADSPSEVEAVPQDITYSNKSDVPITSSQQSNELSSTSNFGARSHHEGHSMLDDGQQCVSSSGYFDSPCNTYVINADGTEKELLEPEPVEEICISNSPVHEDEGEKNELMDSETVEDICSSIPQVNEHEIDKDVLVVPKTVADICNSVPQVNVHGIEREELLKSVTVVEICSNVPQVEREELLESENTVDVCGIEPQLDENETERDDFVESEMVEETCSSSVSQVNEINTVVEETSETSGAVDICNNVPQVDENLPEKDAMLEPETVVEICTSTSQDKEIETERGAVRERGTVVEICSSAPQVQCPILVSSFPEMQCRVLKKYIIAQKRGGQLTEWSTQLYNMVDGTPVAREEFRRPPTVVDLTSGSIPQVFQVSETIPGRGGFSEPGTVMDVCSSERQITGSRRPCVHVDPFVEVSETVTEEVLESEIVTDICCYDSTLTHESHSVSHHPVDGSCALDTERPEHKDASSALVEMPEHMESAQPLIYYEEVVSENDPSTGDDVFITLEDKDNFEASSYPSAAPHVEFAENQGHCNVLDYNNVVYVKNSPRTSMDVNTKDSIVRGSSYSDVQMSSANQRAHQIHQKELLMDMYPNSAVSRVHNRRIFSLVDAEYNEAKSSGEIRDERPPSTGWVVREHVSLQQSDYGGHKTSYMHDSPHVTSQKDILGPLTEQTTGDESADSVKNDQHEECVLYFENVVDISPASTLEETPVCDVIDQTERGFNAEPIMSEAPQNATVYDVMDHPGREFSAELIMSESPRNAREAPPGPSSKKTSKSPNRGVCAETVDYIGEDRSGASADVQKDVSGGQRSDRYSPQHSGNTLKKMGGISECSKVALDEASHLTRDDVVLRARLKRHRCKKTECEGGECRCEQDSMHTEKWPPHIQCAIKQKGFSHMVKDDRYRPSRTYRNFSVTKDVKENRIALRGLQRDHGFAERSDFLTSWTKRCVDRDDATRNTLDLEYLRFIHNINQVIKSQAPYTPTVVERLPIRKMPEARCRSPLVITVMRSGPRQRAAARRAACRAQGDYEESSLKARFQEETPSSRYTKKHRPRTCEQAAVFHFNKLNYKSKPLDQGGPSGVTSECVQTSSVMLGNIPSDKTVTDQSPAPLQERPPPEQQREPMAQKDTTASFTQEPVLLESIIMDLCSNLHSRLNNVASEACKKLLVFYILEIEAEPYFLEIKIILKRDGYSEMEPLQFIQAERADDSILTIIMRNEDIAAHIQEIPELLHLKMLPCVTFAGVDRPKDITDGTYQMLFDSGGFVVSDETVLETVTLGQLEDILKLLEKLNRYERWRWLLHYRESKNMKEESRVESVTKKKDLLIKSCQESKIVEVLHYHQCDSKSAPKSEDLTCLRNLQIQHIGTRFAIFLTDKPNNVKEACRQHGILVADVNTFVETVQKLASTFNIWL